MKNLYKRLYIGLLVLTSIALIGVKDAESGEKVEPNSDIGIKAANERLVASDVTTTKPFWCGPGHMLAYSKDNGGLLLQNVDTGEVVTVSDDPYNRMVGCTNDGKWLVYLDVNAPHKGDEQNPKYGNEMVRYEVATGRREAFAIAYSEKAFFSPLDDSIYLLGPHPVSIEMPEPKWDIIWSGKEYASDLRLGKPSVVLSGGIGKLIVDVLEPERQILELDMPVSGTLTVTHVDAKNMFYIHVRDDWKESVVKCSLDLEKESVECKPFLEGVVFDTDFDIFNDGKRILKQGRTYDLVEINIESGESRCIGELSHNVGWYLLISQDEKMVAFDVSRRRGDGTAAKDLYVVDLRKTK